MHIAGARVLVTGGARRLGRAIALGLGERGRAGRVHLPPLREPTPTRPRRRSQPQARAGTRSPPISPTAHAARRAVEQAAAALGGLDVLVHAASGGFVPTDPMDVGPELFADAIGATLTGGFFCAQAARARWARTA